MQKVFCLFTLMCTFSLSTWTQTIPAIPVTSGITCIARDSNNNIWVGTNAQGLWKLDATTLTWASCPTLVSQGNFTGSINFNAMKIADIAVDPSGGVWLANSGNANSGASSTSGGVDYLPNGFSSLYHYNELMGTNSLPSRYVTTIDVDKNGNVWVGCGFTASSGYYKAGGLAFKAAGSSPSVGFTDISATLPQGSAFATSGSSGDSRQVISVAGGADEVWVGREGSSYNANPFVNSRIAQYNNTGSYQRSYIWQDVPVLPFARDIVPSAVLLDKNGNGWCGIHNYQPNGSGGFCVRKPTTSGFWNYHEYKPFVGENNYNPLTIMISKSNSPLFPKGAFVNNNAIWEGIGRRVFIGTNKGLIVYDGTGDVGNRHSYFLFTAEENCLSSNDILGGADGGDGFQWIATPTGIMHMKIANFPEQPINQGCTNPTVSQIEIQMISSITDRKDYHYYKVSTAICDQQQAGTARCNQTYIYNLMKSKAVYATPTPTSFLLATPSWLAAAVPVLRIPFAGDLLLSTTQAITNPTSIVPPCTEYSLYNNTMLTLGRTLLSLSRATSDCPDVLQHWAHDKVRVLPDDTNKTVTNYTMPGHSLYPGKVTRYVIEECGKVKIVTIGIGLNNCGSGFTGSLLGRSNIIVGADAFKNIDLRLKSGFDANE